MSGEAIKPGDSPKPHGDKLQSALGTPSPQREIPAVAEHEAPRKDHGDKLQSALDRATGD